MDSQKTQVVERLRSANNILVTVSSNPSVDQLASAIGLTLILNSMGKHVAAVFSGKTPSTIEFLQPEKTFEKDPNSLRDFIISLDKSKADKLRYKVEDKLVKIFITPYKTSLSQADFNFEQGEFNVEVVLALGITKPEDLDHAITEHGGILHDATVVSVSTNTPTDIGSVNWMDPHASSLSEMLVGLAADLKGGAIDNQMATAFLTGIVAATNRFSNERVTSKTMEICSQLMLAGANQQLVANQLAAKPVAEKAKPVNIPSPFSQAPSSEVKILHSAPLPEDNKEASALPKLAGPPAMPPSQTETRGMVTEPPVLGGQLTANTEADDSDSNITGIDEDNNAAASANKQTGYLNDAEPAKAQTIDEIEKAVAPEKAQADNEAASAVEKARSAVSEVMNSGDTPVEPTPPTEDNKPNPTFEKVIEQPTPPAATPPTAPKTQPQPPTQEFPPGMADGNLPNIPAQPKSPGATPTAPFAPPPVPPPMLPPMPNGHDHSAPPQQYL